MDIKNLLIIEECAGNKGCPNSVIGSEKLMESIKKIAEEKRLDECIKSKIKGPIRAHNCFKVGIANCPNACSQVQITDFAVIGKIGIKIDTDKCINCGKCVRTCFERALSIQEEILHFKEDKCVGCGMCVNTCKEHAIIIHKKGYNVLAGGKLGRHPMLAIKISDFATFDETLEIFKKIIDFYITNSIAGERLGSIFQRLNINNREQLKRII